MGTVLYTSNFGRYDDLGLLTPQDPEVDCVCFTDDPSSIDAPAPWQVVVEAGRYEHPRMSAKWYKLMPHVLFPDHEASLYTDASMHRPSPSLVSWATSFLAHGPIAAFAHPYFDDAADDAVLSASLEKYRGLPVVEQVAHYRAEGLPEHAGHWATGVLARRHHEVVELDEAWLRECNAWTYQDQLSFPVVAWRLGVKVTAFDQSQLDNPYISPGGHRRQD